MLVAVIGILQLPLRGVLMVHKGTSIHSPGQTAKLGMAVHSVPLEGQNPPCYALGRNTSTAAIYVTCFTRDPCKAGIGGI